MSNCCNGTNNLLQNFNQTMKQNNPSPNLNTNLTQITRVTHLTTTTNSGHQFAQFTKFKRK